MALIVYHGFPMRGAHQKRSLGARRPTPSEATVFADVRVLSFEYEALASSVIPQHTTQIETRPQTNTS